MQAIRRHCGTVPAARCACADPDEDSGPGEDHQEGRDQGGVKFRKSARHLAAIIHRETVRVLALPEVRERFGAIGMAVIGNTPTEFGAVITAEMPQWAKVIRDARMKAD
jgi:hypothetical protein